MKSNYCENYEEELNCLQEKLLKKLNSMADQEDYGEVFKQRLGLLESINKKHQLTVPTEVELADIALKVAQAKKIEAEVEMMHAKRQVDLAITNSDIELKNAQISKIEKEVELMEPKAEAELAKIYSDIERADKSNEAGIEKLKAETAKIVKETKVLVRSKTAEKIMDSYIVPVVKGASKAAFGLLVLGTINRFERYDSYSGSNKDIARRIATTFLRSTIED